jgi:hypothetical protein
MTDWLDYARKVATAADLDDAARREVERDLFVGEPGLAIFDAVTSARSPLPKRMLQRIRRELVDRGWYDDGDTKQMIAAIAQQEHHAA